MAHAEPGLYLRWEACFRDGGLVNRNFACNSNTGGPFSLVESFELPSALHDVSGVEIVLDVRAESAALPAWWRFHEAGSCRRTGLAAVPTGPRAPARCRDWAEGRSMGGLAAYRFGPAGPGAALVICGFAVPSTQLIDLVPAIEYIAGALVVNAARTVGPDACGGCFTPATITLRSINVVTSDPNVHIVLTRPGSGNDSHVAKWQPRPT